MIKALVSLMKTVDSKPKIEEVFFYNKQNEYVFGTLKWSPEAEKLVEIPKNEIHEGNDEQQAQKVISLYLSQLSHAG